MKQYTVTGMSCAACQARVEKAVSGVEGVTSCAVSLLTNSMGVEGTASDKDIIAAVEKAGYGAMPKGASRSSETANEDPLKDTETPVLKRRLVLSAGFLIVLMYFSMGHNMWNFPIPSWFTGNTPAMAIVQMILAAIVMIINHKFFKNGFSTLVHGAPNMDTLVAMGSMTSFVWSVIVLFMDSAAFMAVSPVGTIITVLVKGMAAGYLSGLVFRALEGKNRYTATLVSAVVCPLANTGIFLLGCVLFFLPTVREWGLANGFDNVFKYMMIGFVGLNFVFELLVNVILSPVIVRLIDYARKRHA